MNIEWLLIGILSGAALVPLLWAMRRRGAIGQNSIAGIAAFWSLFFLGAVLLAFGNPRPVVVVAPPSYRPIEEPSDGYVGSATCRSCHPHEHETWDDSYHQSMTQVVNEKTVLGNFDDVVLRDGNVTIKLQHDGDEFTADMRVEAEVSLLSHHVKAPIVLTTGSHHYQAYWYKGGDDTRLIGMLPYVYLLDEQRWIPRNAAFLKLPQPVTFNEAGRWNRTCIRCHATHGRPRAMRFDGTGTKVDVSAVDTKVAEFGISCESCHGPGEEHVEANRNPLRRYQHHLSEEGDPTITNPANLSHEQSTQVCGQCHGIFDFHNRDKWLDWIQDGYEFRPGEDLTKSEMRFQVRCDLDPIPPTLAGRLAKTENYFDGSFWSDGMVRVSGREYNGMVHTPCYTNGTMSCLSCHQMHQGKSDTRPRDDWANDQMSPEMTSNQACTQCHQEYEDQDVVTNHTHHSTGSSGNLCYNCHMPHTTYGLLKAIRSHTIDSPSVEASLKTGRPNACNQCHLDKTLQWSADYLAEWHGQPKPTLSKDEQDVSASLLWLLKGDAGQRALMAWSYGWDSARDVSGTEWMTPFLAQLFDDDYAAIRVIAGRTYRMQPEFGEVKYDCLLPQPERRAMSAEAIEQWQQQFKKAADSELQSVLIGDDGTLNTEEIERLLRQRNNRRVDLLE